MARLPEVLYSAGHKPFDFQLERLIALLRIALAAFSVVTFYMDPIRGNQNGEIIVAVLIAYTAFGLLVALIPIIGHFRTGWQLPVHLVDIGLISLLLFFLESVSRQFLLLYTFVLLGATVRWNWRGAAGTTVLLLGLGALLVLSSRGGPPAAADPSLTALNALTQNAFLLVIGGMFMFFGASRERGQARLAELAEWPAPATAARDGDAFPLDAALTHIANVMRVPRILILWERSDEPFLHVAHWIEGRCHQGQRSVDAFGDWTMPNLAAITFASVNVSARTCITIRGPKALDEPLISPALESEYKLKSIATAPFAAAICTGRIFMLGRPHWEEDDLILTEIVASRIGIELEHYALRLQLADAAAAAERIRVARDLHDGILQSLTAAGLQLKALASDLTAEPKSIIDGVRKLLLDEQQRIRFFVEERHRSTDQIKAALHAKMQELVDKNTRHWGCKITFSVTPEDAEIRAGLGRELEFILAEAVANAVRHGQASHVDVAVRTSAGRTRLWIRDNGCGLSGAIGAYEAADLAMHEMGPMSLRNRIVALSGSLTLFSSSAGVELHVDLPA